MKSLKLAFSIVLLVFISKLSFSQVEKSQKIARYGVKSGMIDYKKTIKGKVLMSKIKGSGTSSLYFKDWGAVEIQKEKSEQTTTTKFFGKGKTETTKINNITKLDYGKITGIDLDKKRITTGKDISMDIFGRKNKNAYQTGEEMLEDMGGEKIGTEEFLGYKCDVWKIPGGTQLLYKGAMLKLDMKLLGLRTVIEATSAKFDIDVPDKYFELPDIDK